MSSSTDEREDRTTAVERFWESGARSAVSALVMHLSFLVLFAVLDAPALVALNVVSSSLWAAILLCVRRRSYQAALTLSVVELVGHAAGASWQAGWGTDFHLYALLVVPIALQAPQSRGGQMTMAAGSAAAYSAAAVWLTGRPPQVDFGDAVVIGLRLMNLVIFFSLVIGLSLTYAKAVTNAEEHLRDHAERDPLTGLYNRRTFQRRSAVALLQDDGQHRRAWLVFVDIDHFKAVNDLHGHAAGDDAIRFVADLIVGTVRQDDLIARWGGEEFVILLLDVEQDAALALAERIRADVRSVPRPAGAPVLTVTIGIGEHRPAESLDTALASADAALYDGKRAGRDRVQLATRPA